MKKLTILIFAALLPLLFSCQRDLPQEVPYLTVDVKGLSFGRDGTVWNGTTKYALEEAYAHEKNEETHEYQCPRVSLRSNLDSWEIAPEYAEDLKWIFIHPSKGSRSGKFFVSVDENNYAASRSAVINVVSEGKVKASFTISQTGSDPYLELDMGGITNYSAVAEGCDIALRLKTNVQWNITASDPSWVEFLDRTETGLTIRVQPNTAAGQRSTDITVAMAGEGGDAMKCTLTIIQLGGNQAFTKAVRKSFSEVQALSGTIEDNIYVEGTVISDYRAMNVPKHRITIKKEGTAFNRVVQNTQMWIQDESGKGLCVEFVNVADNNLLPGTKVKVHLVGHTAGFEPETGMFRITGLSASYIHDKVEGAEPAPVEVSDLSKIAEYENSLVLLKNVSFAMPCGTLLNVDELNIDKTYSFLEDASPREYPHLLINAQGQSVRLMTACSVPWRHIMLMPKGGGDVCGIVCRRLRFGETEFVIRLRSIADIRIPDDESTAVYRTLVRFGPYAEKRDMDKLVSDVGFAEMKTSLLTTVSATATTLAMTLNAWAYIWDTTFPEGTVSFPTRAESNMYSVINSTTWWNGTGSSITDVPGEAWIVTLSTLGAGSGKLGLAFSNASYARGPRNFCLEWSTDEGTPADDWKHIADYDTCSLNANWQLGIFFFPLPDEMKGLEKVIIRHRVVSELSTYGETTKINTSGTNRTAYWRLMEMK